MKIKNIIITLLLIIITGVSGFFIGRETVKTNNEEKKKEEIKEEKKEPEKNDNQKDLINHKFTRTYNINHIAYSNDFDYLYITIREFQGEEIETVKVSRELFEDAKEKDNYEITFKIKSNDIEDNIKSIFKNSEVISAKKTDKTGLEQISDSIE